MFVDSTGRLGRYIGKQQQPVSLFVDRAQPNFRRVCMLDSELGIAVGDQSAAALTTTGGETWTDLSASPLPDLDFVVIAKQSEFVWLAGNPGNRIVRFNVRTRQLEIFNVPFKGQINAIEFVSEKQGWIAGSLGSIFATRDGGKTWIQQRGQQKRVALLVVAENHTQIPLEVLAKYNGEEGYLSACLTGARHSGLHVESAIERLGNNQLEQVPPEHLTPRRIARTLCTQRPSVVVICGSIPFTEMATQAIRWQ